MNAVDIQRDLNILGFGANWVYGYQPRLLEDGNIGAVTQDAVRRFQACWNPNDNPSQWLAVDGVAGDQTQYALSLALYLGSLVSPHFRAGELSCKHCNWINTKRDLLHADEVYRSRFDAGGLSLVSVTRCVVHNRDVGGATFSTHVPGGASDLPKQRHIDEVVPLRIFSGLEISHDGWIVHGDVRHTISGYNPSGYSPANPAVFRWPTTLLEMLTTGWTCQS